MKHKLLTFALMGAFVSSMLFSCSQENEVLNIPLGNASGEWTVTVQIPGSLRTRSTAQGTVGSDGLYTFNRSIDRLWYSIYYDGQYLYDSETENAPQPANTNDGKFTLTFNVDKENDPSKTYIFFWAGNSEDNVTTDNVTSISDGINLNFAKRCVSVDPKYMNGGNESLEELDSFAGYVQLSDNGSISGRNISVTLQRPFAQIHILSDEFKTPGVSRDFPEGVTVVPGFGSKDISGNDFAGNLLSPTTWFFDDEIGSSDYKKNEYIYSQTNYHFTNSLSGNEIERVTFKGREMDYLGCYYVFAPIIKSELKSAAFKGGTEYSKLNIAFYPKNSSLVNAEYASVSLPEGGIKANNKYVIYNRPIDTNSPSEGGDTGSGFLSTSFLFDVIIDDIWGDKEEFEHTKEPSLEEIAWGIPLKQSGDTNWGRVGNISLWNSYKSQIGRYLMTNDGKAVKLDPTDSNKYENGGVVDESKGQIVVIAPNLYYFVEENNSESYPTLWMSTYPISDNKIGGDSEYIVIGAYMGVLSDDKLLSRSGLKPTDWRTIDEYWNGAQTNGTYWGITNWDQVRFMMMLGLSEYGNPNIQENLGHGLCGYREDGSGTWSITQDYLTGGTKILGDKLGKIDVIIDDKNPSWINLFGIENPYGWCSQYVQGIYFGSNNNDGQSSKDVFIYEGNRLPSEVELKTTPIGNYRKITRFVNNYMYQSYISKMFLGKYFDIIATNHSQYTKFNEYWCDAVYYNNSGQYCSWGGTANHPNSSGLGFTSSTSSKSSITSARLAYYGPVSFVSSKEI